MYDHFFHLDGRTGQPFGGLVMSQTFSSLYWFERFLLAVRPRSVLELGTANGAMSVFFGMHCPGWVRTVDLHGPPQGRHVEDLFVRLGIEFRRQDALSHVAADLLTEDMPRPLVVFCDNGNKQLEFEFYAPHLVTGDGILVHDLGSEFDDAHPGALAAVQRYGLQRWKPDELAADRTLLAAWIKP